VCQWNTINRQVRGRFDVAECCMLTGTRVFVSTVWLVWLVLIDHHWHMLLGRQLQVLVIGGSTVMHKSSRDVTVRSMCHGCKLMHTQMHLGAGCSKLMQNAGQDETFCGG